MIQLLFLSKLFLVSPFFFPFFPVLARADFPIDVDIGGVKSRYTDTILKLIQAPTRDVKDFELTCIFTPENELYIGLSQAMRINASLEATRAVMNDIDNFKHLFPDYQETKIISRNKNRLLTFWEQKVPIVPNVKYEMIYLIQHTADKSIYRYQLHRSGPLKSSDGFILLRKEDATHTQYLEYDFFDAEWGAAKFLGKGKIWHDAVEGIYHSDVAAKLKAENPKFTHEQARKEALKEVSWRKVENCLKNKNELPK